MKINLHTIIAALAQGSCNWGRRWHTEVCETLEGGEEREARRSTALKSLKFTVRPETAEERAALEADLRVALSEGLAAAPFWGRASILAEDLTAGSDVMTLEAGRWNWAVFDYVFLLDQATREWEVRWIGGSLGANVWDLNDPVTRTLKKGTLVWPFLYGKLSVDNISAQTGHLGTYELTVTETDPARSKADAGAHGAASYLGRLVCPFEPDWKEVGAELEYDLRGMEIGFGKEVFAALQTHPRALFECQVWLTSEEEIGKFDCFTNALYGRLNPFWMMEAFACFRILSAPAADTLIVKDAGLAEAWANDPSAHVAFTKAGQTTLHRQIESVTDLGDGTEEVVLTAATAVDATWEARRLRCVRLASDEERGEFAVERRQVRRLRVVEVPIATEETETLTRSAWLYTFWIATPGGNTYWRLTSYEGNLTSGGDVFTKAAITHGEIRRSIKSEAETVKIEAARDAANPLTKLWPLKLSLPLWVKIEETTVGDPDTTAVMFVGVVRKPENAGKKIRATAASFLDALGMVAPTFSYGAKCNHRVFGAGCNLNKADYDVAVTVTTVSADKRTLRVTGAGLNANNPNGAAINAANYFALGWIEAGAGAAYQVVSILKSTVVNPTTQDLVLSWAWQAAAGGNATIYPGCDGRMETCETKYGNEDNFGGHTKMPLYNPSIARPGTPTTAAKK